MTENTVSPASPATPTTYTPDIPDWRGKVDQGDPVALAAFFNSMPEVKVVDIDIVNDVLREAIEKQPIDNLSVAMEGHRPRVVSPSITGEGYYAHGGTHGTYGNFVVLWSVRGPGSGPKPRPCFMFCDNKPVWLKSGEAAEAAKSKHGTGIIPLTTPDAPDERTMLIYTVAWMIGDAVTGPAIGAYDLAEMIVDEVAERLP